MGAIKRAVEYLCGGFSWKLTLPAVFLHGLPVLGLNHEHAVVQYVSAGGAQAIVSILSTGLTGRWAQYFAAKYARPWVAYPLGSGVPALATLAIAVCLHWAIGTPELVKTCAWVTFVSATTSFLMNLANRNHEQLPNSWMFYLLLWLIRPPKSETKSD